MIYPILISEQGRLDYVAMYDVISCTNMSREPRERGDLGTTDGVRRVALGRFATQRQANRAARAALGYAAGQGRLARNDLYSRSPVYRDAFIGRFR